MMAKLCLSIVCLLSIGMAIFVWMIAQDAARGREMAGSRSESYRYWRLRIQMLGLFLAAVFLAVACAVKVMR